MHRIYPLALILLVIAAVWRREPQVPPLRAPRPETCFLEPTLERRARMDGPEPDHRAKESGRERWLEQKVTGLEAELRENEQKLAEHRARISQLNKLYGDLDRAAREMAFLRERNLELETRLEVLETVHVERVGPLRRSD